ncbi:hypothetical protein ACQ4PT_043016 [Festuca glaucescens]
MAAAGQRQRLRALVMVHDSTEGYLVYRLNLKHLFSGKDNDEELRCFPCPVARFPVPSLNLLALAPSGTDLIVAASGDRQTTFHNTDSNSASSVPDMHGEKFRPVLLTVGDDMFFAMSEHTWSFDHPGIHYEALVRTTGPRRWAWRALREPPVPDFLGSGRQLLFGFCSTERRFCAVDVEARPPVILREREQDHSKDMRTGYMLFHEPVELAYFGGGRFCISRHTLVENSQPPRYALTLMAVEVTPELQLLKRNIRSYLMSPSGLLGCLLPAPAGATEPPDEMEVV